MKSGRLTYNKNLCLGEVVLPQDWIQHPYVFRLDCIRDWIYDLQKEFDSIVKHHDESRAFMKHVQKRMDQVADKISNDIAKTVYGPNTEEENE